MDLQIAEPWRQREGEADHEYAWFKRYAELGKHRRSLPKTSAELGVPLRMISDAASLRDWKARTAAYDDAIERIAGQAAPNDEAALARQYAIGMAMMDLGIEVIKLKNPALIRTKEGLQLLEHGAEMARRGAGVADLTVEQRSAQDRVERMFLDLLPAKADDEEPV